MIKRMDEDDSVPDLEGWDPGEEMHANLIGAIDGVKVGSTVAE